MEYRICRFVRPRQRAGCVVGKLLFSSGGSYSPMPTSLNATICVDGNNYESEESMPENIRLAFERVVSGALKARRSFFVGQTARFVPKLKSTIVCNSEEFTNVSELPSGQRRPLVSRMFHRQVSLPFRSISLRCDSIVWWTRIILWFGGTCLHVYLF